MDRPKIEYPCQWRFRVIGIDDQSLRGVVRAVFLDREYAISGGNVSSGGKYCSVEVEAEVSSEADRDAMFQALADAEGVRTVL
jgi:putative lipoic acid-binding regulatory protein